MKWKDWYLEKTKTGKAREEELLVEENKSGYRVWEDLVTGTLYCIEDRVYRRICKAGREKLEECFKSDNLKGMEEVFYPSAEKGVKGDMDLFAELPYFMESTKKCARICDYACIRTAFLYAIKYGAIKNSADPEAEKKKLRLLGLSWGFIDNQEEIPELEWIEKLLQNEDKGTAEMVDGQKADFVKGGLVKIKQYYLETNKIPEIRGASCLLEQVNGEKTRRLIEREHIRECLIYAGGGKMMGIFPKGCGEDICQKLELMAERETVTAQSNFCSRPYNLESLSHNYNKVVEEMDLLLEERQGIRWDFRVEPKVEEKVPEERLKRMGFKKIGTEEKAFCTSCRNRYAVEAYLGGDGEEKLCQSCLYKKLAGGREEKQSGYQRYRDYVKRQYGEDILPGNYNRLEDIAENGFIGIIYGDANNMGSQINSLESFMMMRYFSEMSSDTVTDIVFEAFHRHLKGKPSFEIIALGGDDIFLIVPGKYAYGIACTIGTLFDRRFQNRSTGENKMTMSVGVCITHDNMPVRYSFEIARELLKSAKQKAWEERQAGNNTGTIDWMVIENEMAGGADLRVQRRREDGKARKVMRPYTWRQAEEVGNFLLNIKGEKSFAFRLWQSWRQHTKEESGLFYEYQISRKGGSHIHSALCGLAEKTGGRVVESNIEYDGEEYSPWTDVIELWDYMEGME